MMVRSVSIVACWGRTATLTYASTATTHTASTTISSLSNKSNKATTTTTTTMQTTAKTTNTRQSRLTSRPTTPSEKYQVRTANVRVLIAPNSDLVFRPKDGSEFRLRSLGQKSQNFSLAGSYHPKHWNPMAHFAKKLDSETSSFRPPPP